jgi:hypothetical protein
MCRNGTEQAGSGGAPSPGNPPGDVPPPIVPTVTSDPRAPDFLAAFEEDYQLTPIADFLSRLKGETIAEKLANATLDDLQEVDQSELFESVKYSEHISEALVMIAERGATAANKEASDVFDFIVGQSNDLTAMNDTPNNLGRPKRGLAARVFSALLKDKQYETICKLIEKGVDTTEAFNTGGTQSDQERGLYSGWLEPLQHRLARNLHALPEPQAGTGQSQTPENKGMSSILECIKKRGELMMMPSWVEVKESPVITEFNNTGGTIWGFESMRQPYVQAAHTLKPTTPVRMKDIWDAVWRAINADGYKALLQRPKETINDFVDKGEKEIKEKWGQDGSKWKHAETGQNAVLENFRKAATSFLTEFSQQLPRLENESASQAGIDPGKLNSALACSAGLWWAKATQAKVYYCLDGINMNDVIDYKKVRNQAIDAFLRNGGQQVDSTGQNIEGFAEVITMVEIREILKHWDIFSETVVFFKKGQPCRGTQFDEAIQGWIKLLKADKFSKTPAPDRKKIKDSLAAIDGGLPDRIDGSAADGDGEDAEAQKNYDARAIVRKHLYLARITNTRPEIALAYIARKCDVLVKYSLLDGKLAACAANFQKLLRGNTSGEDIENARKEVEIAIGRSHSTLHESLTAALVRRPSELERSGDK